MGGLGLGGHIPLLIKDLKATQLYDISLFSRRCHMDSACQILSEINDLLSLLGW